MQLQLNERIIGIFSSFFLSSLLIPSLSLISSFNQVLLKKIINQKNTVMLQTMVRTLTLWDLALVMPVQPRKTASQGCILPLAQ